MKTFFGHVFFSDAIPEEWRCLRNNTGEFVGYVNKKGKWSGLATSLPELRDICEFMQQLTPSKEGATNG